MWENNGGKSPLTKTLNCLFFPGSSGSNVLIWRIFYICIVVFLYKFNVEFAANVSVFLNTYRKKLLIRVAQVMHSFVIQSRCSCDIWTHICFIAALWLKVIRPQTLRKFLLYSHPSHLSPETKVLRSANLYFLLTNNFSHKRCCQP